MKNSNHRKTMEALKEKHKLIADVIGKNKVVLLDIPIYDNIGDLLIMLGTLDFLKKYNIDLVSTSSVHSFSEHTIGPSDVILLHGGGNFGDLYLLHQNFREDIIKQYPNNKILILPQTIYFESNKKYEECCKIFNQHKDIHIFVRDLNSFSMAEKMSNNVYLMPDMAHQLFPILKCKEATKNKLVIQRVDIEAVDITMSKDFDTKLDWKELVRNYRFFTRVIAKTVKIMQWVHPNKYLSNITSKFWIAYSEVLVNKAIHLYSNHNVIITNRLHGHILACLMNIENTVYDNTYGKNSSYVELWTEESDLVTLRKKHNNEK